MTPWTLPYQPAWKILNQGDGRPFQSQSAYMAWSWMYPGKP